MYLDFFGLKEAPFSIAPDPRYLYMSERHREALAHLLYGVSGQGGFIVLTGEVGTGKTTICRCFLNQVPKNTDVAYIVNPKLSARELMASICDELDIHYPDSASIKVLSDLINRYLLAAHADNRHTVLIIDEAQNLRVDVLEQLRLLTNLETAEKKLLQIILLGQPELREILAQNELRQLAQRVTARYHLHELNKIETGAYVKCRLAVADRRGILFNPKAIKQLFKLSKGTPRLINLIADRALLGAYAMQSELINADHIRKAHDEIQGEKIKKAFLPKIQLKKIIPGLFAMAILVAGFIWINQQYIQALDEKIALLSKMQNTTEQAAPIVASSALANAAPSAQIADNAVVSEVVKNQVVDNVVAHAPEKVVKVKKSAPFLAQITGMKSHEDDKFKAYQAIFDRWGAHYEKEPFMLACDFAEQYGLRCLHKNGNWRSLLKLDRPAILTLINELGERLYFGLLAIEGEEALISHQGKTYWVALDEIDRYWLGEYSIVWKLPPYKSRVIEPGQLQETEWLSLNLQRLKPNNNVEDASDSLESMIKAFQSAAGLIPDGIAGSMTIIHMNSRLGFDCPKLLSGV